jgi:hypothetical protein
MASPSLSDRVCAFRGELAGGISTTPTDETKPNYMSKNYSIMGAFDLRDTMTDIAARFAESPLYRLGFEICDADLPKLAEIYRARVFRASRSIGEEGFIWRTLLLRFGENLFLIAHGNGRNWAEVFAPDEAQATQLHSEVAAKLADLAEPKPPFFYMLRYECGDFYTQKVEHLPEDPGDDVLRLCYGDDIVAWLQRFREQTCERPGGLSILEGPPGTGKTSLVGLMIRRFVDTHVFYVLPTAQHTALSSPELVPFWETQNKRHPKRVKVIVIEDAERLLWPRNGDNRELVSTVLNIADGLTGRMLRLHMLCSVNARLVELDPAIRRPGRLTNQRSFRLLNRATAKRLAEIKELPFCGSRETYSLAEVLNPNEVPATPKACIGFGQS